MSLIFRHDASGCDVIGRSRDLTDNSLCCVMVSDGDADQEDVRGWSVGVDDH